MGMVGILKSESKLFLLESVTAGEVWLTTYLVLVIPLCFALFIFGNSRHERRMALGATVLAVVCLVLTSSRAGLLALVSELGGLVWSVRQKVVMVAAALIGLLVGLVMAVAIYSGVTTVPGTDVPVRGVSTGSLAHRLDIWT
jgi:O-antigen ligase